MEKMVGKKTGAITLKQDGRGAYMKMKDGHVPVNHVRRQNLISGYSRDIIKEPRSDYQTGVA